MDKGFLICLFLSAVFGSVCYFVSESIYLSGGVLVLSLLVLGFLCLPLFKKCFRKRRKGHECFKFINSFAISLSATKSLSKAYDAALEGCKGELKDLVAENEPLEVELRIKALSSYFESDLYEMFLSVLEIEIEQGGDMLELSRDLIAETTRSEENAVLIEKESSRYLFNFCFLYSISIAILLFMRFGLTSFYAQLKGSLIYIASIGVYFAFLFFAVVLYSLFFTREKISFRRL